MPPGSKSKHRKWKPLQGTSMQWPVTSSSLRRMLEEIVWPSRSVLFILKMTESSTLKYTESPHTQRSIFTLWFSPPTEAQAGGYQNPTPSGSQQAHEDRGEEEGTKTHQGSIYPNWAFVKKHRTSQTKEDDNNKQNNTVFPYSAGASTNLRKISNKHWVSVHFKPCNTPEAQVSPAP